MLYLQYFFIDRLFGLSYIATELVFCLCLTLLFHDGPWDGRGIVSRLTDYLCTFLLLALLNSLMLRMFGDIRWERWVVLPVLTVLHLPFVNKRDWTSRVVMGGVFLSTYRWYDWEEVEPLYAYGYGLSYTTFEYSDLTVTPAAEGVDDIGFDVSFTITNTGDVTGSEIAQVYVTGLGEDELPADVQTYVKQLCGFARVEDIRPGESREVTVHVNQRSLSYWWSDGLTTERADGTADKFHVFPGERTILVGAASDNILLRETVDIQ